MYSVDVLSPNRGNNRQHVNNEGFIRSTFLRDCMRQQKMLNFMKTGRDEHKYILCCIKLETIVYAKQCLFYEIMPSVKDARKLDDKKILDVSRTLMSFYALSL